MTSLTVLSWAVWAAFAADFAVRLWLAEDTLAVRPAGTGTTWRWSCSPCSDRCGCSGSWRWPVCSTGRWLARWWGQVSTYVVGVAVIAVGLGAIAVLDAEQDADGANITTFGDALWWAATTVTTVGYGDRFPVTTEGRLMAVALMVVGIAMVGAVTASVAAWMVSQVERERTSEDDFAS